MDEYMKQWFTISCIWLTILFGGLYLTACSHKEPTADEKNQAGWVKAELEITEKGAIIEWKDGHYSMVVAVDKRPNKKNTAIRFKTGAMHDDQEWIDLDSNIFLAVKKIHHYDYATDFGKARYAEALRKAVFGKIDQQDKPVPAN